MPRNTTPTKSGTGSSTYRSHIDRRRLAFLKKMMEENTPRDVQAKMLSVGMRDPADPGDATVDCEGCHACCCGDDLILHPECGDTPALYAHHVIDGLFRLAHKPNGDCFYLNNAGQCSIYHYRPVVCREFDCRLFAVVEPPPDSISSKVITRGRQLAARFRERSPGPPVLPGGGPESVPQGDLP